MKIVILDGFTANPGDLSWERFEAIGQVTVYDRTPPESVVERIGDAEIIIINKSLLTDDTFSACPNIKYVGVLATGYNIVDIVSAKKHGVIVTNIPSYSTDAVAQHTFALLLAHFNHIATHNQNIKEGKWNSNIDFSFPDYPLREISGKTMGIIGMGNIGSKVSNIAKAFGMNTIACGRNLYVADKIRNRLALDDLLAQADIITLHCPLTAETSELINAKTIAKMKDKVVLINASRGGLINEQEVADALNIGRISAFLTDVTTLEPPNANNPLLTAKNVIMTPHIAWAPFETRRRLISNTFENLEAFLKKSPINVVNL